MKLTKNQKIKAMKFMAQIVSTYHMLDVLSVYSPIVIAGIGALSLGIGEYLISQEYATMGDKNKLKKLMLYSLIGLSAISTLANVESFVRFFDWSTVNESQAMYVWFAGIVYSAIMPTVIVTTSFIRLKEEKHEEEIVKGKTIEIAEVEKVEEPKKPELVAVKATRTRKNAIDYASMFDDEAQAAILRCATT